jgi:transposase
MILFDRETAGHAMSEDNQPGGKARVVRANRSQLSWDLVDPEGWLPADHRARLVAGFVETLDLALLYDKVEAREGGPGRPPADPAVLFALWLLATMDGGGSARALDRLTSQDLAYRWLAARVPVNYHGLADFRVAHADVLDELLTTRLAAFVAEGLVVADEIIVDGTEVAAAAGKSSYKRALQLDEAEAAARTQVATLKAEVARWIC